MKYMMISAFRFMLLGLIILSCSNKETEEQLRAQAAIFEKEQKFDDALKIYEKQLEYYPDGKFADETLYKVASLYYNNLHDFTKSIELHKKLIKKYPKCKYVDRSRFMIGYIYANDLKDYDKAREAYTEFLVHHADTELADSVRWELEHLGQDINEQLENIFPNEKSNGDVEVK